MRPESKLAIQRPSLADALPQFIPAKHFSIFQASDIVFRGTMEEDIQAVWGVGEVTNKWCEELIIPCLCNLLPRPNVAGWSKTCTDGVTLVEQCPSACRLATRAIRASALVLYFALLWPDQSDSWSVAGSCTARPLSARKVRESFKAPARLAQPQAALSLQLHKFTQQQRSSVPLCI